MFLLLYVEFSVAHFKRRNSRGRAKMEKKRGNKGESISILIHPQGRSIVLVIGETFYKHRTCERERRRREAVLGVSGGMLPRKIFEKLVHYGQFWLIF